MIAAVREFLTVLAATVLLAACLLVVLIGGFGMDDAPAARIAAGVSMFVVFWLTAAA